MSAMEKSPLALAFLGDAVLSLYTREALLLEKNQKPGHLHLQAAQMTSAKTQAACAKKILPCLTEEEFTIFRRGKNAKPAHRPQTCTREEYALATGLECLFGWLWLNGDVERARKLFSKLSPGLD